MNTKFYPFSTLKTSPATQGRSQWGIFCVLFCLGGVNSYETNNVGITFEVCPEQWQCRAVPTGVSVPSGFWGKEPQSSASPAPGKGHREGTQWAGHGKLLPLWGATATLQRGVPAETVLGNFGENPSAVLTLFQTSLRHHPLVVQIFNAFSKHCATKHLPSYCAVATLSQGPALNLYRISVKKSALQGDFYCYQASKC